MNNKNLEKRSLARQKLPALYADRYVNASTRQKMLDQGVPEVWFEACYDIRNLPATRRQREAILAALFKMRGLDISRPIKVAKYFDERTYLMRQSDDGQLINLEDFAEY